MLNNKSTASQFFLDIYDLLGDKADHFVTHYILSAVGCVYLIQ